MTLVRKLIELVDSCECRVVTVRVCALTKGMERKQDETYGSFGRERSAIYLRLSPRKAEEEVLCIFLGGRPCTLATRFSLDGMRMEYRWNGIKYGMA